MKYTSMSLKYIALAVICIISIPALGQKTVAVDNWFNQETNAKTGKIYHYTWDDTENSGFSQLGDLFKSKGAQLKTIGNKPDNKSLAGVNVYIIVDPDTTTESPKPNYIQADDINVISNWVKQGGTLLILANDKPNCEFTHLNNLAKVFGMHFNPVTLNRVTGTDWEMGAEKNLPDHPVFKGVKKIYLKEVSSITSWDNVKPVLTDDNNVFMAETKFGKGFVFAVTDPWIYNEYIDHKYLPESFDNLKAANNLCDYLLQKH
jgi:unsaturated rhamnogalacturonyl hydrolase